MLLLRSMAQILAKTIICHLRHTGVACMQHTGTCNINGNVKDFILRCFKCNQKQIALHDSGNGVHVQSFKANFNQYL